MPILSANGQRLRSWKLNKNFQKMTHMSCKCLLAASMRVPGHGTPATVLWAGTVSTLVTGVQWALDRWPHTCQHMCLCCWLAYCVLV